MRKVSLEMNLGKKSKARFPRRISSNLKMKIIAPAMEAKPLPPLGPALSLFGVDSKSFCEDFNTMSKDYDIGFPVSLNIWVTQTKNYYYNFRSPSTFEMFHRCFDFYEGADFKLKPKIVLLYAMNISLIKNVDNDNNFMDRIVNNIKQILGSLRSYGFFSKKTKKNSSGIPMFRKRDYIFNTKFTRKKL